MSGLAEQIDRKDYTIVLFERRQWKTPFHITAEKSLQVVFMMSTEITLNLKGTLTPVLKHML